jgi:hypothetical protein
VLDGGAENDDVLGAGGVEEDDVFEERRCNPFRVGICFGGSTGDVSVKGGSGWSDSGESGH